MNKYTPLAEFLRKQSAAEVPMTFAQIERLIGSKLPRSHRYRAWWSNNSFNSVMTKAWLDAGFKSSKVDLKAGKLVFERVSATGPSDDEAPKPEADRPAISKRHPLYGAMKGLIRIAPGVDLTEPADPDWADIAWGGDK